MKSRIWRLAGVGLLCMSVGAQALAENQGDENQKHEGEYRPEGHPEGHPGGNEGRPQNNQPRPQAPAPRPEVRPQAPPVRPPAPEVRPENNQRIERHEQAPAGQWQAHPPQNEPSQPPRPAPAPSLPIQPHPDSVRQTQEPLRGNYSDIPRRNGNAPNVQGGNNRPGANIDHHDDRRWPGRPDGRGNGWGPGPQYRPGYEVDRFPDRNWRVPYRGEDYFFSGGYWYRPQGSRYVVVAPPRGIRTSYLPDYAREVWIGGSLFFLAAGAYYLYQEDTQDYVVVDPPAAVPQEPQGNGYDVVAYPASGQSPQQVQQDGEDCYRWAVQQSGFDPANVTYAPAPAVVQAYRQAQGNCLSSRGYQVSY